MKKILLYASALLLFAACQDIVEYEPGAAVPENAQTIWFVNSDERGLEVDPQSDITSHEVVIARAETEEALTVGVEVTVNTGGVFSVPQSVSFGAGESTAILTVDFGQMEIGQTYSLNLQLSAEDVNYYIDEVDEDGETILPVYALSVTPIKYETYTGVFVDDILANMFNGLDGLVWYVVYEVADMPDGSRKIRVLNPYYVLPTDDYDEYGIYPEFPYNDDVDLLGPGDYNLYINISADGVPTVDGIFQMGIDWGYGPMFAVQEDEGGVYEPSQGIFYINGELSLGDDDGIWTYGGFALYFSLESYLEDGQTDDEAEYPDEVDEETEAGLAVAVSKIPSVVKQKQLPKSKQYLLKH